MKLNFKVFVFLGFGIFSFGSLIAEKSSEFTRDVEQTRSLLGDFYTLITDGKQAWDLSGKHIDVDHDDILNIRCAVCKTGQLSIGSIYGGIMGKGAKDLLDRSDDGFKQFKIRIADYMEVIVLKDDVKIIDFMIRTAAEMAYKCSSCGVVPGGWEAVN